MSYRKHNIYSWQSLTLFAINVSSQNKDVSARKKGECPLIKLLYAHGKL